MKVKEFLGIKPCCVCNQEFDDNNGRTYRGKFYCYEHLTDKIENDYAVEDFDGIDAFHMILAEIQKRELR